MSEIKCARILSRNLIFYYTHFEITFYLANWLSLSSMIYTIYEF